MTQPLSQVRDLGLHAGVVPSLLVQLGVEEAVVVQQDVVVGLDGLHPLGDGVELGGLGGNLGLEEGDNGDGLPEELLLEELGLQ